KLAALHCGVWLMIELPNASMQLPWRAPGPTSASALPLKPKLRMTCEPAAIVGATGATAGVVPWLITSGLYTWIWPSGARIVASMNTPSVPPLAQVQPSPRTHGVASPWALSGLAGTDTVQFVEAAASSAFWVKLNAFPAASTAFAPASPARFAALFGGMAKSAAVAGLVAAAEPDADGQGAAAAELAAAGALAAGALAAGALAAAAGALAAAAGALAAAAGALAAAEAHEPR